MGLLRFIAEKAGSIATIVRRLAVTEAA